MTTLETQILSALKGTHGIFFIEDARIEGATLKAVRFSLARLANEGHFTRVAWGIYCKPDLNEYSLKRKLPKPHEVADAVARRDNLRLVPCGAQAAARVGLIRVSNIEDTYTWLSDGAPRLIKMTNGYTVKFVHSSDTKVFSFTDDRMRDLSNGIRHIKESNIGDYELSAIRIFLEKIPEKEYQENLPCCPEWVRDILVKNRGGAHISG